MEESKNMSESLRVYASHSAGSQFDKAGVGFPGKIISDERWSWKWKTVLNSFEGLINWPVFKTYVHCLKWSMYSEDPSQQKNVRYDYFHIMLLKRAGCLRFFDFVFYMYWFQPLPYFAMHWIRVHIFYLLPAFLCWTICLQHSLNHHSLIHLSPCLIYYSTAWAWC